MRAFAWLFFAEFAAQAQTSKSPESRERAEPRIQVRECPADLAAALPAVVKLELDVLSREQNSTHTPATETVIVLCMGERTQIEVSVQGTSEISTIDLAEFSVEHRARAIALAAAELVHSLASEGIVAARPALAETPQAAPPQAAPPLDARTRAPSRRPLRQPALLVGGLIEWLGKPVTFLAGARLAFQYPLGRVVAPALSLDGTLGGFPAQSANISIENLALGAHLYLGTSTGRLRWEAGPGARLGWVRLAGHPDPGSALDGRTLSAAWSGAEARARFVFATTDHRSPLLALELGAGIVALPVRGLVDAGLRVYAVDGPWLSVCAELGLGL